MSSQSGNRFSALFGEMDVTLHLLDMGFTDEEVSSAIDNFGPEVPICELADSIFARRIALNCGQEDEDSLEGENQNEPRFRDLSIGEQQRNYFSMDRMEETVTFTSNVIGNEYKEALEGIKSKQGSVRDEEEQCLKHSFSATEMGESRTSSSNAIRCYEEMHKRKKAKHAFAYERTSSHDNKRKEAKTITSEEKHPVIPMSHIKIRDFSLESRSLKNPEHHITGQGTQSLLSKPPFFLYGNVSDVSQVTWRRLSQFLYGIEPECVNTQLFSAFMRKEGYFHNLPRDNRFHILPKPPMTIEDALPHTKRWWPSWDTRKQFSCISLDTAGAPHICDRLQKMLKDSEGILPKGQQVDALHQCKTLSLVWVGQHRLSPIEPEQIERILGYPVQHTQIQGLELNDRLGALKCCFQTDTLGYHLSVLKKVYPAGLRVLSVFSGIGGAEIALHRLGIHLQCVVSVDVSHANQTILKRWWQKTGQSGELVQIDSIERLTGKKIESLIGEFGGFDLVIGANPCACFPRGPRGHKPLGIDTSPFHEFSRVFKTVRSIMGRNQ